MLVFVLYFLFKKKNLFKHLHFIHDFDYFMSCEGQVFNDVWSPAGLKQRWWFWPICPGLFSSALLPEVFGRMSSWAPGWVYKSGWKRFSQGGLFLSEASEVWRFSDGSLSSLLTSAWTVLLELRYWRTRGPLQFTVWLRASDCDTNYIPRLQTLVIIRMIHWFWQTFKD